MGMLGASPVFAQDPANPNDWTGFYAGAFGGAAFGDLDGNYDAESEYNGCGGEIDLAVICLLDYEPETIHGGFDSDEASFLGGFQAGYNIQSGNLVFGVVGDITKTHIEGSATFPVFSRPRVFESFVEGEYEYDPCDMIGACGEFDAELEWLATLQAKLGYAKGNLLFFVKGGPAWGKIDASASVPSGGILEYSTALSEGEMIPITPCNYILSCDKDSDTPFGYTVGVGMAAKLSKHMFAELGYSFVDLGEADFDFDFDKYAVIMEGSGDADFTAHLLRFGLNWQF
jgi:outer membrane immunogenic protein